MTSSTVIIENGSAFVDAIMSEGFTHTEAVTAINSTVNAKNNDGSGYTVANLFDALTYAKNTR